MPGSAVLDDSESCSFISHGKGLHFEHQQLHRIHRHTGIPLVELREAAARLPEYRLYFGLLQRRWLEIGGVSRGQSQAEFASIRAHFTSLLAYGRPQR
eukprot:s3051_g9.t1